jgi:predicted dehydrogenase
VTVGVALVGAGGMGRRHALGYAALEAAASSPARLVAICDRDAARAAAAAREFAAVAGRTPRVLDGLDAALADSEVDAVDLVVPTRFHHALVVAAIEAGRHVLVEKPFAITVRAAEVAIEAAERTGLTLAVAENYRRVPTHRALRGLLTTGAIGRPYLVLVHTVQRAVGGAGWYSSRSLVGSLPNLEFAVHEADLLRHLLGEVAEVTALTAAFETEPEDAGLSLLRFASGAVGQLSVLTAGHGGETGGRLIVGSKGRVDSRRWEGWEDGSLRADGAEPVAAADWVRAWLAGLDRGERERLLPAGSWDQAELGVDIHQPLRYGIGTEIHDFATAVATGRPPEVDARAGLSALAICLALLESARVRSPVAVADVLSGRVRGWQSDLDESLGLA